MSIKGLLKTKLFLKSNDFGCTWEYPQKTPIEESKYLASDINAINAALIHKITASRCGHVFSIYGNIAGYIKILKSNDAGLPFL